MAQKQWKEMSNGERIAGLIFLVLLFVSIFVAVHYANNYKSSLTNSKVSSPSATNNVKQVPPSISATPNLQVESQISCSPGKYPNSNLNAPKGIMTRCSLGEKWPLLTNISYVVLKCQDASNGMGKIVLTAPGYQQIYAVNGAARNAMEAKGWSDIREIWRDDPQSPGLKVNIDPLIDGGLKLCS